MLAYLTFIFCCQLAGEVIVRALGVPVPGPVLGMLLLFLFLFVRGSVPESLSRTADALLGHLSLLFVPAGVGIMLHYRLIEENVVPITIALIGSTALTIAATGLVMSRLNRLPDDPPHDTPAKTPGGEA